MTDVERDGMMSAPAIVFNVEGVYIRAIGPFPKSTQGVKR
jgi:hypothetical protein